MEAAFPPVRVHPPLESGPHEVVGLVDPLLLGKAPVVKLHELEEAIATQVWEVFIGQVREQAVGERPRPSSFVAVGLPVNREHAVFGIDQGESHDRLILGLGHRVRDEI